MTDSNTETAKWYPLRAASEIHATVSTTEDAPRAATRHEKEMSGADSKAENQTNRQTVEASGEKQPK